MQNLLAVYLIDKVEPFAKWITIAIFSLALISIIVSIFVDKSFTIKLLKIEGLCLLLYSLLLGIFLLSLEISKKYDTAYLEDNWVNLQIIKLVFVPLVITLSFALITAVLLVIVKNAKAKKLLSIILGSVFGVMVIISLTTISIYYSKNISNDGYYSEKLNNVGLYVGAVALVAIVIVCAFMFGRKDKKGFNTRAIAFAGITIAISFVLSYIKLWEMPQGGSITLVSMLPIMIFAYVYGCKKGVLVGAIYGLLQAIQDPFIIHPAQFILDYPLAFSMVGFVGLLKDFNFLNNLQQIKFAIGGVICGLLRYISHVLSGVFAFGAYAPSGQSVLTYSLIYNTFVFVDISLVIIVGVLVFSSRAFKKVIEDKQQEISAEN
ncbi:MAG: energy-coupled thiamine transporter ThiT [Clostridia bacterium]|nr:energy-coupled thiamine transporter ThiT [Clostridia bacterium]